jgi:hypothetical protein
MGRPSVFRVTKVPALVNNRLERGTPITWSGFLEKTQDDLLGAIYALFSLQNFISSAEGPYMPGSSISFSRR